MSRRRGGSAGDHDNADQHHKQDARSIPPQQGEPFTTPRHILPIQPYPPEAQQQQMHYQQIQHPQMMQQSHSHSHSHSHPQSQSQPQPQPQPIPQHPPPIQPSRVQYGMIQAADISPTDEPEQGSSSNTSKRSSKAGAAAVPQLKKEKFGNVSQFIGQREKESDWRYELLVRQQPLHARMCGFGEKDRRPIDPPPIIQLNVYDTQTQQVDLNSLFSRMMISHDSMLQNPFFVLHVTLWSSDGREERNLIANPPGVTRVLMGSLVSSPSLLKDNEGLPGCFFVFPDLSIRTEGVYRLKFSLMKLGTEDFLTDSRSRVIASAFSEPFTVYSAKKFPGMTESTELSKAFAKQGIKIPIRNDVRSKKVQE